VAFGTDDRNDVAESVIAAEVPSHAAHSGLIQAAAAVMALLSSGPDRRAGQAAITTVNRLGTRDVGSDNMGGVLV
jgi:hypothetical protein